MTITKASAWRAMPTRVAGQRVAEDEDAAGDAGDVGRGAGDGDDRDGLAVLQAAGRGVEGGGRGGGRDEQPGADEPEDPRVGDHAAQRLDGDVADAEEDAGGRGRA